MVEPFVADDAVQGRNRATHKRSVAAGGDRPRVNVVGVPKNRPAVQQLFKTSLAELILETRQVIVAELINHYADDQTNRFRDVRRRIRGAAALLRGGGGNRREVYERENNTERGSKLTAQPH